MAGVLSTFLKDQKAAFLDAAKTGNGKEWIVVMGNEAGDLDSIASAIAFAWYASKLQGATAVPLTQTPRAELHLRAENLHALELAHLNADTDILCIDDVPHTADSGFPSSSFALVDHNRLGSRFSHSNSDARVVAVVDHHEDEGLYHDTANPRLVAVPTGSCASLVTQLFQDHPEGSNNLPPELATLLLCSILIDTSGLKPGGKAEAADNRAARFLIPRAAAHGQQCDSTVQMSSVSPSNTNPGAEGGPGRARVGLEIGAVNENAPHETPGIQGLHTTLQEKKASVAHLGTLDLLKRDYKEYTMIPAQSPSRQILVGLSSVPVGFASWLPRHADFWSETEKFMVDRGLTVLGILTSFRNTEKPGKSGKGKHRREQMYVVRGDEDLTTQLFDALEEAEELQLKRKKFPEFGVHNGFKGSEFRARVWAQKNVDATRKATAPLVKSIIEGRPKASSL
ncbi:DHH phosphoesterase [Lentinus tigrinus ALCF2SS1-7]|uniref:DHH phosphoesterase n=1 Tax=Lentinus tigrinus ALCF2SS1-6 TaxID=1328759 RepID=A0A5C2SD36_9APHY|nr:DHH phosphoesterase [Lentinus tigrinus ALCF2SS1-6]RPD76048.1 DHH phosphoesterase [Lentinus tigrinus ALCF2SS1-7]